MVPIPYTAESRQAVADGDVLLFKSTGLVAWAIRAAGRTRYSHAALAVWVRGRLMVAESRELRGCRLVPLSSALASGQVVDLYQLRGLVAPEQRLVCTGEALRRLGQGYGWGAIARMALTHLPLLGGILARYLRRLPIAGRLVPRGPTYSEDDLEPAGPRLVCSAYVSACWRSAGVDLVPNLADGSTEPGDLARSAALLQVGRLEV